MKTHDYLTDQELLEHIIPHQAVKELTDIYGNIQAAMMNTSQSELVQINGIGKAKAKQLVYIAAMTKRLYQKIYTPKQRISSPKDVYQYYQYLKLAETEEFHVLYLNVKNTILLAECISKGSLNASIVTPREIFCRATRCRAAGIILVHNHPSGLPEPSNEDIEITENILQGGKLLGITVLDHMIIGKEKYCSMKEKRFIFD